MGRRRRSCVASVSLAIGMLALLLVGGLALRGNRRFRSTDRGEVSGGWLAEHRRLHDDH